MGRRTHAVLLLLGAVLAGVLLLHHAEGTATRRDDPARVLTFSHRQHVKDAGMECRTCHEAAWGSTSSADNLRAGLKPVCGTCHDVQDAAQCTMCHPANTTPVAIPNPPRDIVFSHAAHINAETPNCLVCHAGFDEAGQNAAGALPTMSICTACHDNRQASNTCEVCHANVAMMLPGDHRLAGFTREHRNETRLGALTVECQTCHTERFCQECHQGAGLKAFSPRDVQTDAGPRRSTRDAPAQTVLQNVHSLNYRFSHGIDAKARESECGSCHTVETFCAECHAAGTNFPGSILRPSSHDVAGFTSLAPGARGGLHAEEARRDLETCVTCHNIEGQDPSCLQCHQNP